MPHPPQINHVFFLREDDKGLKICGLGGEKQSVFSHHNMVTSHTKVKQMRQLPIFTVGKRNSAWLHRVKGKKEPYMSRSHIYSKAVNISIEPLWIHTDLHISK